MNPNNQPKETTLIAYHAHCIDGFTAAYIAVKAMYDRGRDVVLIDMEYNEESMKRLCDRVVETKVKDLVVVDFSLDYVILDELHDSTEDLEITILDHHKTAFERYAPHMEITPKSEYYGSIASKVGDINNEAPPLELNNDECGASLVWKYYNCAEVHHTYDIKVPALIQYIRDYDLWRFDHGNTTKWVNKYLCSRPKTLVEWARIFANFDIDESRRAMKAEGRKLQDKHDLTVERIARLAEPIVIKGRGGIKYEGLAVSCEPKYNSDVGQVLAGQSGSYGLMYNEDYETGKVYYSLRANRKEYDVTVIAKQFNGGGHAGAAGFELSYPKDIGLFNRLQIDDDSVEVLNTSLLFDLALREKS